MSEQIGPMLPHPNRKAIAIWDPATGRIKQTVFVTKADAEGQHIAWPGHESLDVTKHVIEHGHHPHPNRHAIDVKTKKVIALVHTLDELRAKKLHEIDMAFRADVHHGLHHSEDFTAHRADARKKLADLNARVTKAKTAAAFAAIEWGKP